MNTKVKKYSIIMGIITLILVSMLAIQVNAEEPTTGSITIVAHEQQNGDTTTNPPMEGIEYTIYKVDETVENTAQAEEYITTNSIIGSAKTTGEDGTVIFNTLELGRYYVKVTNIVEGVVTTENFLADIPMTNVTGTGWNYDITVEPKIQTSFGNLEMTKVDSGGNPIEGSTFKVQYLNVEEGIWKDYILEGSDEVLTVTTDKEGKIKIENIPFFENTKYKLVEISAPDNYIINDYISMFTEFYIDAKTGRITMAILNMGEQYFVNNKVITDDLTSFTYVNENPEIVKKVQNSEENFVDSIGANVTDRLKFKVVTDVPMQIFCMKTYKISDELPQGIVLDRNSIKVEGTIVDGSEIIPEDVYTLSQDGLELAFDTSKMYNDMGYPKYNNIIITYEATIDKNNVIIGGDGNINTATLEYTNNIGVTFDEEGNLNGYTEESTTTVSDTAEVHTGAVLLEKVEKGNISTKLAGAKFKIATTKENAEDGIFVKDETGADIEVTTGDNGQAIIEGLKYADDGSNTSYWLVETQAPSYQEDGVTKYYNLLKAPLEVQVGKTTHESAVQIENGKGFDLPETGSIGLAIFTIVGIAVMAGAVVLNKKQIKE